MIAIPWYFIEIIEKPKFFTYCYFIITFLTFFWGMYAGTIIDRYSRKKIFLITNFICGTIIASVSAYGFYNQSTSEYFVILVFLITIFNYNVHYFFIWIILEKLYFVKIRLNFDSSPNLCTGQDTKVGNSKTQLTLLSKSMKVILLYTY